MSLLSLLTGGKSDESSDDLNKALAAIQGVSTPTADEMKYQLEQYVQAGILTPEQAQTFLQSPNALASENVDQTGTNAQQQAIAELLSAANAGGLNPAEQAQMQQIQQQLNTQEKGANDAAVQNQAARGALTGGETLAAQLQNNQNATANANQNATATAGQAYQNMLNELTSAGSLGGNLQGQQNTQANTVASATNAINQFNAAQQQNQANFNTQNSNAAQAANLQNAQNISNANVGDKNAYSQYQAQLPQQVYEDQLQKANSEANIYGSKANQATGQGNQNLDIYGGIASALSPAVGSAFDKISAPSAAGTTGGSSAAAATPEFLTAAHGGEIQFEDPVSGPDHAPDIYRGTDTRLHLGDSYLAKNGGEIPGQAAVPGNSSKNDTVPTMLSPGEVVLPRTVAQHPTQDKVMAFLHRMRKPQVAHPDDVATVLHALGRVREG